LAGVVGLLQQPVLEHDDAVAHRHGFDLVVGDVDRGDAEFLLDAGDLGAHVHTELGVEVRQWLVHQEHFRRADQRTAHRDTLTLATGQVARLAVEVVLELQHLRSLLHPVRNLVFGDAGDLQRVRHVLADRHVWVQGVVLEHRRDVTVLRSDVGHVLVGDE